MLLNQTALGSSSLVSRMELIMDTERVWFRQARIAEVKVVATASDVTGVLLCGTDAFFFVRHLHSTPNQSIHTSLTLSTYLSVSRHNYD